MSEQNASSPQNAPLPHSSFSFISLYHIFLEKLWLIALCFVISLFLTGAYIQRSPRLYSSTATLQVEQGDPNVVNIKKVQDQDMRGLEILRTIEQTLQSDVLFERVITANKLASDPRFVSPTAPPRTREQMLKSLEGMVNVRLRRFTRLIDVTTVHTNPEIAALVSNSLVKEYMKQNLEQYKAASNDASDFLLDEAQRLKKKLQESENALQAYREKTKTASLEQRQENMNPQLMDFNNRLTAAKSIRMQLETQFYQANEFGTNVTALLTLPAVTSDPTILNLQARISQGESTFANLQQRYKDKHPKYVQAQSELEELKKSYSKAVKKSVDTIKLSYESSLEAERKLEVAVSEQESIALQLNKQSIEYNVLAREVESDRVLYESVIHRLKETSLAKELPSNPVRVVQTAEAPELPFSPDKKKLLILGLFAGLVGGFTLALGINSIDSSIRTVDQAEEELHLPVLSAIPQIKDVKSEKSPLVVSEDAKSAGAEAFRSLRTSLTMLGRAEDRRVFLFTSALPQEGKTFCSVNYAMCLAQQGLRTVLIDGDLRRPAVENALFGKRTQDSGVTDFLIGQKELKEIARSVNHEKFYYIPAGTTAPNPAELLAQGNFTNLIEEALKHFDRVVIDSAPIHAVSDTLLMLKRVQTVCIVVRACKTPQKAVFRSIQMLQKANAPMAGVILNRLPQRRGRGYYYDPYYDYSYHGKYAEKGVYGA